MALASRAFPAELRRLFTSRAHRIMTRAQAVCGRDAIILVKSSDMVVIANLYRLGSIVGLSVGRRRRGMGGSLLPDHRRVPPSTLFVVLMSVHPVRLYHDRGGLLGKRSNGSG